jgi:Ca-activated chloride channel family protein
LTPDQQASQAFEKGEMQKAADLFNNPQWKGAAQYKAGEYEQALKSLEGLESADDWYNKGNALARLSRYPEAIEAYKKALELNPEHKDAEYNKALIEKLSQQNQKSQQSDSQQSDSQKQEQKQQSDSQKQEQKQDSQKQEEKQESAEKSKSQQSDEQEQTQEKSDKSIEPEEESQTSLTSTPNELEQAKEQLLRQIPDDPGGLLRRKFKYQYQQQPQQSKGEQPW